MLLYHYCSAPSAFSILKNRSIRLSPLSAANDTLEGRVLGKVFRDLLSGTHLRPSFVDVVSLLAEFFADHTEGFAFCLSESGDLLSQWRAYAMDGRGFAIAFNSDALAEDFGEVAFGSKFFEFIGVRYGETELRAELGPFIRQLETEFRSRDDCVSLAPGVTRAEALGKLADRDNDVKGLIALRSPEHGAAVERLLEILRPLHFKIYNTKAATFHEEREWRLLRYRHRVHFDEIGYSANEYGIRPYIECEMSGRPARAIEEVLIGPRNSSDINWLRAFLRSCGLGHVRVTRSSITSYR